MQSPFKPTGYGKLDLPARKAVKALSKGRYIPSDKVVSRIYQFGSVPESQGQRIFSLNFFTGAPVSCRPEVRAAFLENDLALAIFPKSLQVIFNPSAIFALLQRDPDVHDRPDWKFLVYSLVIYNFRVANITKPFNKVLLDIHQLNPKSFNRVIRDTNTPSKNRDAIIYSLIGIMILNVGTWFGWIPLHGWQVYGMIGFAFYLGLSILLSGNYLGIKLGWAILIAVLAFTSFIFVLFVQGYF